MARPSRTEVLIVFDVDGTISRIYREREYEEHKNDKSWMTMMPFDQEVIAALDEQTGRPGVETAWLTTWDPEGVEWLIRRPLGGRLAGSYVPHHGWPKRGWRLRSLIAYLRQVGPAAVVWADDAAPAGAASRIREQTGIPALVIKPDKFEGVTHRHVQRVRSFIDKS